MNITRGTYRTWLMLSFVMLSLMMASVDVYAQQKERSDSIWRDVDLEHVIVTGTRTPKTLKDTPIQTRMITAADIAKTDATNIEDLLQQELPGVEFTYAMNQQVNMNLSGFAGQSVLLLVDGERLAGETMDNIDFTRLSMANIECIEVVKGSASALYGSCAAGGVVNIITKRTTDPLAVSIDGRWGEHNSQRYNANVGFCAGMVSNALTISRTSSDNYEVHNKDNNAATRTFANVYGDKTWNFKDVVNIEPSKALRITGHLGYFFRTLTRTAETPERYRDYSAGIKGVWQMTKHDNMELAYCFDQYDKSDYQTIKHLDIRKYSNVQNSMRLLYNHHISDGSILTLGGDYLYDFLMNSNLQNGRYNQKSFDVFGQYDWNITRQWELVGALRYDHFSDGNISKLTPKLSARWKADRYTALRGLVVRASYGMGFRAPSLKEKYYNFDMASIWIVEGNQALKAETSHNFNVSVDFTRNVYNFTLAGYYNKVYNRITTGIPYYKTGDTKQLYLNYINLDKMDVYNIEATAQARWHSGLGAKVSYVYSYEQSDQAANQYMPARHHSLTMRVDYTKQLTKKIGVDAVLSGRAVSGIDNKEYIDMYDISKGTVSIHYPGYALWKLQLSARWQKYVSASITLDNIFNYKPDYYYYNAPLTTGRNVLVGVRLNLP